MGVETDRDILISLLSEAAEKLAAVEGSIWSSYNTGADIAKFVLECRAAIEAKTLSLPQKRELWGIFAPTCDWDDVVGDCDLGNRVFELVDRLYRRAVLDDR